MKIRFLLLCAFLCAGCHTQPDDDGLALHEERALEILEQHLAER